MRNGILFSIIALMILIGCKPRTNSSTLKFSDSSKSAANGLNIPDIGGLAGKGNSSGLGSWSKEYRNKFMQVCIGKASEQIGAANAYSYCSCMTDKVEAKYPNENEVDAKLTDADISNMKVDCPTGSSQSNSGNQSSGNNYNNSGTPTQTWSASAQQDFMNTCVTDATKTFGSTGATNYCSCMMGKLMLEFPNENDLSGATKEHMTQLAKDCLGR